MKMSLANRRTSLFLAASVAVIGLFGAVQAQAAARADNQPPLAVEAPAPPPLVLSTPVLEAASEYRAYLRHASALATRFESGQAIEKNLAEAESYEPQQLARGAVAYAAIIALQDPAFVAGVRVYAVNAGIRRDMAERIIADPGYATVMPGSATAAALIRKTMTAQGKRLTRMGFEIKQAAYDVQHQGWSKEFVTDREGRLARAKTLSSAPMTPLPEEMRSLSQAVSGSPEFVRTDLETTSSADLGATVYTPFIRRALAIAALASLGQGGSENEAALRSLMDESSAGFCLNMSKLNLYQCLAVAKPWYEDMFCMGMHAMVDTGQCISKAAGEPQAVMSVAEVTPKKTVVASRAKGKRARK